jgi:class 3 adenylate cyclase
MNPIRLHRRVAAKLARHFLVHLDAELRKAPEVIERPSFDGRSKREVTATVLAELLEFFPSLRAEAAPPQNLFERWSEVNGRFVYELYAWGPYNALFLERLRDLAESTTESRIRREEQLRQVFSQFDFRARGVGAGFMLDAENTLRELLMPIIEQAFPGEVDQARRIVLRQSRQVQLALHDFFERTLADALDENERLLTNILPRSVSTELLKTGRVEPVLAEECAVLFTDFVGFTALAERLAPRETLARLERYFSHFDDIAAARGLEKIKTIGDSYMAVAGVPAPHPAPVRAVNYSTSKEGADRVVDLITKRGGTAVAVQANVSKQANIARLFAAQPSRLCSPLNQAPLRHTPAPALFRLLGADRTGALVVWGRLHPFRSHAAVSASPIPVS